MIQLHGNLWAVSGARLSHEFDASAYLIMGPVPTLIDCGSALGYADLKRHLSRLGLLPSDIQLILATHGHYDHISSAHLLKQESNAKLLVHRADRKAVETGDPERTAAFLYGLPFPATPVDGNIRDGQTWQLGETTVTAHHTPGHTPGSVSFIVETDGERILVAGDTLWGGFDHRIRSNAKAWIASLDKLAALEFDTLTWGHCPAPRLYLDAKTRVLEAKVQFQVYTNPWFKPFNREFRY